MCDCLSVCMHVLVYTCAQTVYHVPMYVFKCVCIHTYMHALECVCDGMPKMCLCVAMYIMFPSLQFFELHHMKTLIYSGLIGSVKEKQ